MHQGQHGPANSQPRFARKRFQCLCGLPVPHIPQEWGVPVQEGSDAPAPPVLDANVENFFDSRVELQCGHLVPSHWLERTSTSLSFWHFSQ